MINALEDLISSFKGAASRSQCFLHVINLVVKTILRQFNPPPKKKKDAPDKNNTPADDVLESLAEDLEIEEALMRLMNVEDTAEGVNVEDDDVDGWVDERDGMTEAARRALDVNVRPVTLVLVKVS